MKKIICILSAAAMMAVCFVGCGNSGTNSAVQDASKAVSDVGSQIETVASEMVGDGTVSDTDGVIGNEGNETSAVENSDNNNQNQTDSVNQETTDNELM
ncbi:MAG: hypothetical protein J1E85_08595 [Ruminococcus sp.]|nr:hypothetical protein [Ruminococcus sp.]